MGSCAKIAMSCQYSVHRRKYIISTYRIAEAREGVHVVSRLKSLRRPIETFGRHPSQRALLPTLGRHSVNCSVTDDCESKVGELCISGLSEEDVCLMFKNHYCATEKPNSRLLYQVNVAVHHLK
jgi:hypothetical protein